MSRLANRCLLSIFAVALLVVAPGAFADDSSSEQQRVEDALGAWDVVAAGKMLDRLNADADAQSDPQTLFLTGHHQLMTGQYEQAVEYLSQAVHAGAHELSKHYLQLAQNTLEQTRGYVHHRTAAGNFIISHAPGVDAVLVPYAEEALEQAWSELTRIFDYKPDHPVRVELYPQVDVLGAVSPLTVGEIRTSGTIALCKYNRLMVTSPRDLVYGYDWLDTLSHEFIHLLITKKSRNTVPIWLHEGLAKYYEAMWRPDAEPELERHSETLLAKALANNSLISFEEMSPSPMAKLPSQEATATAFAEVFTVIEYLKARNGGRDVAHRLVAAMRDGRSDREAVAEVAKVPWERFSRVWKAYLESQDYKQRKGEHFDQRLLFKGSHTEADELLMVKVVKARDYVWLGDKMRLKKRWHAASKEYRKAVDFVGDKSPFIQGKLGFVLLRMGDLEAAAEELQKPISLYPRHVVLHAYLGEALYGLGEYDKARTRLEAALAINPFDPDVHGNLAKVYDKLGESALADREAKAHKLVNQ